jgi:hypothetical protein
MGAPGVPAVIHVPSPELTLRMVDARSEEK